MRKNNVLSDKPKGKPIIRLIKKLLIAIVLIYTVFCLGVHLFLEELILWPHKISGDVTAISKQANNVESVEITTKDGNILRGWLVKNSNTPKSNLLIYFGGNAEELSYVIPKMSKLDEWSVALINYRGYGMSEGSANETTLFSDSLEIFDYFASRSDINKSNIVVMGRSIGTGVAAYLAQNRNASAVILTSPYDSIISVVQDICPIVPADLLLKHKFDSLSRAPLIKQPVLILVGTEDTLIPPWHSKKLKDAWGGKAYYEELASENHNSIDDADIYWSRIRDFLSQQIK
ncbi:alpha/beta hydrolase [Pseudobacteroides cellulosolvens]|uniref:AB hydrolase-1 domain-containing protein n=1 Tax=Pseudobacteroides cellulosolvens ATCC 35603 = DSM 2933 TaxID=398512 RepID=A0A0L6JVD9_9FIRM|nr:alpha/beta hydrolase [Pseudobacteroides cellulosolvens]KNY29610.1 hypothetical protein Bccel_4884 [Pseudobacteroides cellulosolvens ATCC 35603 = DSM 2933]